MNRITNLTYYRKPSSPRFPISGYADRRPFGSEIGFPQNGVLGYSPHPLRQNHYFLALD
jgi:hypothetical protein